MKILSIETSAKSASVALSEDGKLLSECFSDAGLTHSKTLMPMVDAVFRVADSDINAVDCFAVAHGPGSFTGIRIGVAAIKGMADACKKPCIGVSTLEVIAYNLLGIDAYAACVMDARCQQVYSALFACGETVTRMSPDEALSIESYLSSLQNLDKAVYLVGDGAELVYRCRMSEHIKLAPYQLRYQRAANVGLCAYNKLKNQNAVSANDLAPVYLRMPQAERELKLRKG